MKEHITKETVLQYIYDYGIIEAAELLNISVEQLNNIVEDNVVKSWNKPSLNKNANVEYLNPIISEFIERNYSKLHSEYVKNYNNSIFYQNDEDIFHNALIKVCADLSNPSEELLLKTFDKVFRTIKWENNTRNRQIKSKELNNLDLLDIDNEEEIE